MTHAAVVAMLLAGSLITAFITWAFLVFSGAATSQEPIAHRCLRLLEIWMWVALGAFYALVAKGSMERKLWLVVVALGITVWMFRHGRSLLARRGPR